jgi:hypothetical protein
MPHRGLAMVHTRVMGGVRWGRVESVAVILGSILAAACNLALPHEDDDLEFIERVARSDAWPWLHTGLFVAVLLILVGLNGLVSVVRTNQPTPASLASGALLVGGALMLSGLAVAGVALRKAADNFAVAIEQDRAGSFFSALGFDRLSYALYAAAGVVLLGIAPVVLGWALWQDGRSRALAAGGVVAGVLGIVAGLVQLTAEVDTFVLYLCASLAVTVWSLAVGALLWRIDAVAYQPGGTR